MNSSKLPQHLAPLLSWLSLAAAIIVLLPLKLGMILAIIGILIAVSFASLLLASHRGAALLLIYGAFAAFAFLVDLPLAGELHPLTRLLVTLAVWSAALLAALLVFALILRAPHATHRSGQSKS